MVARLSYCTRNRSVIVQNIEFNNTTVNTDGSNAEKQRMVIKIMITGERMLSRAVALVHKQYLA